MLHYPDTTKKLSHKRLLLFFCLACALLYIIYALALAPLYSSVSSDIMFKDTPLPFALRILLDITDVLVFAAAFASITYACFRFSVGRAVLFSVIYLGLTVFRHALSFVMEFVDSSYIGLEDWISFGIYFAAEILIVTVVLFIAVYQRGKYGRFLNAARLSPKNAEPLLPFKKVYSKDNPLQICLLMQALLISAMKMLTRIISDIIYGAPTSVSEALVMVIYYLSDVLNGVIFYAAVYFIFDKISKKETALSDIDKAVSCEE